MNLTNSKNSTNSQKGLILAELFIAIILVSMVLLSVTAAPTYDDFSDDSWVRYSYEAAPNYHIIRKICTTGSQSVCGSWGASEILARNVSDCSFTLAQDELLNKNLLVVIAITARGIDPGGIDSGGGACGGGGRGSDIRV